MKLSKYSMEIKIDNEKYMLYNTLSRQYYIYTNREQKKIGDFLCTLNRKEYSLEDIKLLKELMQKEIIIDENTSEINKVKYLENSCFYQNKEYRLIIFPTNACNFRCVYCTQEHIIKNIENVVIEKVITFIERLSCHIKMLNITWFGGEPLLQFEEINKIMQRVIPICQNNCCDVHTEFVTNGYLLNEQMVQKMKLFHTKILQITIDSSPEIHNKRRIFANGSGTYEKIVNNMIMVLQQGVEIILRINIDEETYKYPIQILEDIPQTYRDLVTVSISNIFQTKIKSSSYGIYLNAIQKGYKYDERKNNFYGCATCGNRKIVINTNGNILFCTNIKGKEGIIGKLEKNGIITYYNRDRYIEAIMKSACDNKICRECIELPMCIGRCRLARVKESNQCLGKANGGLSLEERAKLDYYYDEIRSKLNREEKTA